MAGLKDSPAVIHFMVAYQKLRHMVDDDPAGLEKLAVDDEPIKELCSNVHNAARILRIAEWDHRHQFAAPVDPKFIETWRDYEDRFSEPLAAVWLRDLGFDLEQSTQEQSDKFNQKWEIAADSATERATNVESVLDFAAEQITDPHRDFPESFSQNIEEGVVEWHNLKEETGFDLEGVFRRRELVPFVLVPRHVARQHGAEEKLSLFTLLQQAHEAFVFGVPFAALALMRAILEVVLERHYGSEGKDLIDLIKNAKSLPPAANAAKLHRIRRLANDILHFERERLQLPRDMERELLGFLYALRSLIEAAPPRLQGKIL
jgi:hypothetical protein